MTQKIEAVRDSAGKKALVSQCNWTSFILGACGFTFVPLMGRVSLAELLALIAVLPFLIAKKPLAIAALSRMVPGLAFLGTGLVIATIAHEDQVFAAAAAMSNFALVVVLTLVIAAHISVSDGKSWHFLILGAAIGQILGNIVSPTLSFKVDPWKFGIGWSVTLIVLVALRRLEDVGKLRFVQIPAICALAGVHFMMNSRALAVIVLVCAVIVFGSKKRHPDAKGKSRRPGWLPAALIVAIFVASVVYETLAASGRFGSSAADKLEDQSGDWGVLFGARKELVVLAFAWVNSPVIGWGPTAHVPADVLSTAQSWFVNAHYHLSFSDTRRLFGVDELPLHSVLLGGLVQVGMFFVPIGILLITLMWRAFMKVVSAADYLGLFVVLFGAVHLFTSPLGDTTRLQLAMALALGTKLLIPRNTDTVDSSQLSRPVT